MSNVLGDTAPYGHDGRSGTLDDVILRHGGEALAARTSSTTLPAFAQGWLVTFLRSLVLFSPDDIRGGAGVPVGAALPATLLLQGVGLGLLAYGGWLGGELVYRHGVGRAR